MTITTLIHRLTPAAEGLSDDRLLAPGTLPGETVTGTPVGERLQDIRIVTPSPDRVAAPCPHARSCGGCSLQHASDSFVAGWKRDLVLGALRSQGIDAEVGLPETSPAASRRRASFAARRTKKGALAGFHAKRSDVVVEVPNCTLVTPRLRDAMPMVKGLAVMGASRKAALSVQVTDSLGGLDVFVTDGKPVDAALISALADMARTHDIARLTWNGEVVALRRPPEHRFDGIAVVPPPGAFLQATEHGEACLRRHVMQAITGANRVLDLFSGCGTFSLPAARGAQVHAVESLPAMLHALDHGWRHATGLKKLTTEARDLFRNPILAEDLRGVDAVIMDPPRAGAEAQTVELAASQVPVIAHVSCHPGTFARDAARLIASGYRMGPVTVVDQFRWSAHVEICATFTRD